MASKVMDSADRKAALLIVGAKLASKYGAVNVTRRMVAEAGKVSEALVTHHFGPIADAQAAFARKAKALKLPLPDKAKAETIGTKLRAHGPRKAKPARKRSVAEVKAIKRKTATRVANSPAVQASKAKARASKPNVAVTPLVKRAIAAPLPKPAPAENKAKTDAPENKGNTAARAPKLPPVLPVLPS